MSSHRSLFALLFATTALTSACSNRLEGTGDTDRDTEVVDPDDDNDGYAASEDCDDADPDVNPGAPERCNGEDDNCDDVIPAEESDLDSDGTIECEEFCDDAPAADTVSALSSCEYVPSPSGTAFTATIEWAMTHELTDPADGSVVPAYEFADLASYTSVWQAPMVGQLTDDNFDDKVDSTDVPDIAVIMSDDSLANAASMPHDGYGAALRLIAGNGSKVQASTLWTSFTNANGTHEYAPFRYAGLAIANVDGDPAIEVSTLVYRRGSSLCFPAAYEVRQTNGTISLVLDKVAQASWFGCGAHAPNVADIDNDGEVEVIYGRNWVKGGDFSWESGGFQGKGYFSGYWNSGYHSFAYDLDDKGDDVMEVVSGNAVYLGDADPHATRDDSYLYCQLVEWNGTAYVPVEDGYPAVADVLFGDGVPEIVLTGNEFVSVFDSEPYVLDVVDTLDMDGDGNKTETLLMPACELWDRLPNDPTQDDTLPEGLPAHPNATTCAGEDQFGGPPTIADFDGDGDLEIANAGACYYSVFHFDEDDNDTFKRFALSETRDWSSASTGSTVFDFNGDGGAEVVFQDEQALYVYQIDTSATKPWNKLVEVLRDENHKSWTIHEYPVVADVDGDGKAEIVVTNSYISPNHMDTYGLYVLGAADDDWVSARQTWSQHAYYVTNSRDDLTAGYAAPRLNGFRQQEPGDFGAVQAANLFVEAEAPCQDACEGITVFVQVGNESTYITAGTGVVLAIYGESGNSRTLLDSRNLSTAVAPGQLTAGIGFVIEDWASYDRLVAVVDDPSLSTGSAVWGASRECDESDNEVEISLAGLCSR